MKRMQPGRLSEAEATELVARLSTEHGHALPEVVKSARALVMTARATRANVDLLISTGAVEPIVELLSSKSVEVRLTSTCSLATHFLIQKSEKSLCGTGAGVRLPRTRRAVGV